METASATELSELATSTVAWAMTSALARVAGVGTAAQPARARVLVAAAARAAAQKSAADPQTGARAAQTREGAK